MKSSLLLLGLAGCSDYELHPKEDTDQLSVEVQDSSSADTGTPDTDESDTGSPETGETGAFDPDNTDAIVARTLLNLCAIIGPEDCSDSTPYAKPSGKECETWSTGVLEEQDLRLSNFLQAGKTPEDFWNADHAFNALVECEATEVNGYPAVKCTNYIAPIQEDGSFSYNNSFYCQSALVSRDGGSTEEGYRSMSTVITDGVIEGFPGAYSQVEENFAVDPLPEDAVPAYDFNNFWWYSPEGDHYRGDDLSAFQDAMVEGREAVETWMDLVGDPRSSGDISVEIHYEPEE